MSQAQQRSRRQERIESLCAASIRAYCAEPDLHFRGGRLHRGRRVLPLYAPHLNPALDQDDFRVFRGAADCMALRLAHSDAALHRRLCPQDPVERMVFDMLEQFRVEALAPAQMPGLQRNLRRVFEAWSRAFHLDGGTDQARGLLLFTVAQVCRSRVTADPILEELEDLLEATRAGIGALIGAGVAGLRRARHDQSGYAQCALQIAGAVAALLHAESGGPLEDNDSEADEAGWSAFKLIGHDGELDNEVATAVTGRSLVLDHAETGYRIFTTAYDRQVAATGLARAAVLQDYREQLDRRIAALGLNLAHLARDLRQLLGVPTRDGWDTGHEDGHIDGRRLAQLISSPTERRLFRREHEELVADCVVSFLVDCSGSMKEHIETVAVLIDLMVRALEQAGVASEVLGFTTNSWNGGRAQRDWLRAGRPLHPGRLNETCHLVFKAADTPWRRARPGLAAMLKPDLFREGVDGEAVDWAMRRLDARAEQRRLLIVVSDGSPMDSATHLANDAHYLDQHLRSVVAAHELAHAEIYGLGVGLDLSPYYGRSHVLDLSGPVGMATFREILEMIVRGARR